MVVVKLNSEIKNTKVKIDNGVLTDLPQKFYLGKGKHKIHFYSPEGNDVVDYDFNESTEIKYNNRSEGYIVLEQASVDSEFNLFKIESYKYKIDNDKISTLDFKKSLAFVISCQPITHKVSIYKTNYKPFVSNHNVVRYKYSFVRPVLEETIDFLNSLIVKENDRRAKVKTIVNTVFLGMTAYFTYSALNSNTKMNNAYEDYLLEIEPPKINSLYESYLDYRGRTKLNTSIATVLGVSFIYMNYISDYLPLIELSEERKLSFSLRNNLEKGLNFNVSLEF